MLKKFLGIVLVLLLGSAIFTAAFYLTEKYINKDNGDTSEIELDAQEEPTFTIYSDSALGIRFTVSKLSPSIVYDTKQTKTVKDVGISNAFNVLINGGFFLEDNKYAGALVIDRQVISQPAPLDTQLSHVVAYTAETKSYEFIVTPDFNINHPYDLAFQTGPLFIDNNIVQNSFIEGAVNGTGEYQRSFFGVTTEGEVIVGITTQKYTLNELADMLLKSDTLKNKVITVINLDGGSSVALFLGENNASNFGQFKVLPVLLGFK